MREYLLYRMLEVGVAANTVYAWAAEEVLARRLADERPSDPIDYAAPCAARRRRCATARTTSLRAFLDDVVYEGRVSIEREQRRSA